MTEPVEEGVLVPSYEAGLTPEDQKAQAFLMQNAVLEDIAAYASERIVLPQDIPLHAASCGEANASWDPRAQDITFCYEYIEELAPLLAAQESEGTAEERSAQLDQDLIGVTNEAVLHELGHALVNLYDLPVVGKEEDAADQLSALLLASGDERHVAYALSTIKAYAALTNAAANGEQPLKAYADEHSLDAQRFYNWVCWLYGSDPDQYAPAVQTERNPEGILPPERAAECPGEFRQMEKSWSPTLKPYLKT
ncbi:DUF4344 domain-containing metallopeptidase [Streptomyces sp. XY431]|uniref:DUF4344 domain-containing metallopeptidase n=1 Tax=Streptomyces sp. XY431 TaxID=1415562 RepID=UPI00133182D0|nr:DUF4344 domain-containing metallopeptidase [Streptomyces sp. XY431]